MKTSSATSRVFISLATADRFPEFEAAFTKGEQLCWTVVKSVHPGERVVFYFSSPISAFCATGVVDSQALEERGSPWEDKPAAWIRDVEILPRRVPRTEAERKFPEWGYLRAMRNVTEVPPQFVDAYLQLLNINAPTRRPAIDLLPPQPERIVTTVYRILRDTELARLVKEMHGYECQLCGDAIQLPDGSRYAEAHHIQPLGSPHDGPDVIENILCLCPNCHAKVDLAAMRISIKSIRSVKGHEPHAKYIKYHNDLVDSYWNSLD